MQSTTVVNLIHSVTFAARYSSELLLPVKLASDRVVAATQWTWENCIKLGPARCKCMQQVR
jgi:hypothetical protein